MVSKNPFSVKAGILYYNDLRVGKNKNIAGFTKYIFEDKPLGIGANAVTYGVRHKILKTRQVVKLYVPKDNDKEWCKKAKEEAIKNANSTLYDIIAVTFDAGKYNYPCPVYYSIMECVASYATISEWRQKRAYYFPSNRRRFDIDDHKCRSSIHTSLNLAAGLLSTLINLYENNVIHGDLNPGNILWILRKGNIDKELDAHSSYYYSTLGELEPYNVRLIDLGSSKANEKKGIGKIRDAYKLYEHMKSLLFPLFSRRSYKFEDWMEVEVIRCQDLLSYGAEKKCIHKRDEKWLCNPLELAGDFFRLICVLTIAMGIVSNAYDERGKTGIRLDEMDRFDFNVLMHGVIVHDAIKAIPFESMIILQKLNKIGSRGKLINWEKVWDCYPMNEIQSTSLSKIYRNNYWD